MRRFAELFHRLDSTTRTAEKVAALTDYFRETPAEDAAAAVAVLLGHRTRRSVTTGELRAWAAEASGIPAWLVEECHAVVGDLAETIALLLPDATRVGEPIGLATLIATTVEPLARLGPEEKRQAVLETWGRLRREERIVWHKLLTGGFRVGVARTLVARGLAEVAGVDAATMSHRLMGMARFTAETYRALLAAEDPGESPTRPYPFFLASPLEDDPASLGCRGAWIAEWKWDGMRAQLIRRGETRVLWTRGEELASDAFPEIVEAAESLPDGCVLDGEVLAAAGGRLLGFQAVSRRAGRRRVTPKLLAEIPCVFAIYDLLEYDHADIRGEPLEHRRRLLEGIGLPEFRVPAAVEGTLFLSPQVAGEDWEQLAAARDGSRDLGVEGLMLKRRSSPYRVGRPRGDWWKWKVDPLEIDAVLLYAQAGHGRRAALHTDYTLGVWHDGSLVPAAKAYSGLSDAEIAEVDRIIRRTTLQRHGPVRVVEPTLVFQLAFDAVAPSKRHKSGVAVRFPRIARWRRDKRPDEAGRLDDLRAMIAASEPDR